MNGLVSTVIPVFNRPTQIVDAVESVVAQSYRPLEIIIVDDGSTDETAGVLQKLKTRYPSLIKLKHTENRGPGLAREAGRKLVQGDFIQYVDSDDVLYPEKFKLQVEALDRNPHCQVAYGHTRYRSENAVRDFAHGKRTTERIETMFPSFLASRWWNTLTPLYRREVCDQVGPWNDLKQEEDWEYDSRIAALGTKLCFVDAPVCEFRHHSSDRMSAGQVDLHRRLKDSASARILIYQHAIRAGLDHNCAEMQVFSRSAFHLSRQCGAAGLKAESKKLFELSRQASGRPYGLEYSMYRILAAVLGWERLGRVCEGRDQIQSKL